MATRRAAVAASSINDDDVDPSQQQQQQPPSSSQPTRSAVVMDPGQDLSDRRKIRRKYRELIQQTNGIYTFYYLLYIPHTNT